MQRRRTHRCGGLAIPTLCLGIGSSFASEGAIVGRLTDSHGAAVAGATVLMIPADDRMECPDAQVLSDADGAFAALMPPGRYVVAAVKRGYEVSLTEVNSRASRVLRLRLRPREITEGPREPELLGTDWFLRRHRPDVLRDESASLPFMYLESAAAETPAQAATENLARALLGSIDGGLTQSFGAEDLQGLVDAAGRSEAGARTTALTLRAPLSRNLAWSLEGQSARTRTALPDGEKSMTGDADRLAVGVDHTATQGLHRHWAIRGGFGTAAANDTEVSQRVLEGRGELALTDRHHRHLAVAMRAWGGQATLAEGGFLTLDQAAATGLTPMRTEGEGVNFYVGERLEIDPRTRLDYGLEFRDDSLSGESRLVPRLGVSRALAVPGEADLAVRSELLLDPGRPGGRVAVEAAPLNRMLVSASLTVLPANALLYADHDGGRPAARGVRGPGQSSAQSSELDVAVTHDFGTLCGSLSGAFGRTGRRSLPMVEEGPVPFVSFGSERFYETRVGVAYKPWETHMEVGYRRVESEARPAQPAAHSAPLDYRRLDLVVSQALPSPRSLLGARLRALLEWQALNYDSLLARNGAWPLSGLTSRLSGGVGLTF